MGAMSRTKGAAGERELAAALRELTGWDIRRRVRQHDGDSDLEGVPGWSIEVKRHRAATQSVIEGWWNQAVRQAKNGATPVLFYRLDREPWHAVWPISIHLVGWHPSTWDAFDWTVTGMLPAWCAVARERVGRWSVTCP